MTTESQASRYRPYKAQTRNWGEIFDKPDVQKQLYPRNAECQMCAQTKMAQKRLKTLGFHLGLIPRIEASLTKYGGNALGHS